MKIRPPSGEAYHRIRKLRTSLNLATVCEEARCPNQAECWGGGTATFMILGDTCTRACRFCNVKSGNPHGWTDPLEPENLLEAVKAMELTYIVLTVVDRDDLPDGGASHIARCIDVLKKGQEGLRVEILSGDFRGDRKAVDVVLDAGPDVFAHNIETVRRLTPKVRDAKCGYDQSLDILQHASSSRHGIVTKSSIMLGLGEKDDETEQALRDLRKVGVEIVTLGQYLRPAPKFLPVVEYVTPEEFDAWKFRAEDMGFAFCASGPLVRSSYRAGELFLEGYLEKKTGWEV